jgi:hypothetical protein
LNRRAQIAKAARLRRGKLGFRIAMEWQTLRDRDGEISARNEPIEATLRQSCFAQANERQGLNNFGIARSGFQVRLAASF